MAGAKRGEFQIHYVTVIDFPALRHQSFPAVAPGTRVGVVENFKTQTAAVRRFDALVSGEDDFSSEFPTDIRVNERRDAFPMRRCVRRRVERTRTEIVNRSLVRSAARATALAKIGAIVISGGY